MTVAGMKSQGAVTQAASSNPAPLLERNRDFNRAFDSGDLVLERKQHLRAHAEAVIETVQGFAKIDLHSARLIEPGPQVRRLAAGGVNQLAK